MGDMTRRLLGGYLLVSFIAGCATVPPPAARAEPGADVELRALRAQLQEQRIELEQMRGRLALLESAARERREAVAAPAGDAWQSRRVGASPPGASRPEEAPQRATLTLPRDHAPRPVLRIHNEPRVPHVPDALDESALLADRLSIVPVPPLQAVSPDAAASLSAPAPESHTLSSDSAMVEYRRALRDFRQGAFDRALDAFTAFVVRYPSHAYADQAMFWRGESHYAQRAYAEALRAFEAVVARFPASPMVPNALLRIGLSYHQLGQTEHARRYFERLRQQFPDSSAAQLAAREDAT